MSGEWDDSSSRRRPRDERRGEKTVQEVSIVKMTKKRIPEFKTEEEERDFWQTHDTTEYVEDMEDVTSEVEVVRPKKQHTSLRMDQTMMSEIRKLAEEKGMGYQTLMRSWIYERLAEEKKRRRAG